MEEKTKKLRRIIRDMGSAAVAFSGGVDSTFLLKVTHDELGDHCAAITAYAEFMPAHEFDEARAFCEEYGIRQIPFRHGEMEDERFLANTPERCYYCKKGFLEEILRITENNHLQYVVEGSNMDDENDFRPGSRALRELGIRSPLKEVGFSKEEIRECSRQMGLPTWNKPSFACLASRIPYGERITPEKLHMIEQAEDYLRVRGFRQYRVRMQGNTARIEVPPEDIPRFCESGLRKAVADRLHEIGFSYIAVDLEGYRTGNLNREINTI